MPGRSTSFIFVPSYSNKADFFSTVTPGQLPTYSLVPAIAFIRVDLPEFGLPATATVMVFFLVGVSLSVFVFNFEL